MSNSTRGKLARPGDRRAPQELRQSGGHASSSLVLASLSSQADECQSYPVRKRVQNALSLAQGGTRIGREPQRSRAVRGPGRTANMRRRAAPTEAVTEVSRQRPPHPPKGWTQVSDDLRAVERTITEPRGAVERTITEASRFEQLTLRRLDGPGGSAARFASLPPRSSARVSTANGGRGDLAALVEQLLNGCHQVGDH